LQIVDCRFQIEKSPHPSPLSLGKREGARGREEVEE